MRDGGADNTVAPASVKTRSRAAVLPVQGSEEECRCGCRYRLSAAYESNASTPVAGRHPSANPFLGPPHPVALVRRATVAPRSRLPHQRSRTRTRLTDQQLFTRPKSDHPHQAVSTRGTITRHSRCGHALSPLSEDEHQTTRRRGVAHVLRRRRAGPSCHGFSCARLSGVMTWPPVGEPPVASLSSEPSASEEDHRCSIPSSDVPAS